MTKQLQTVVDLVRQKYGLVRQLHTESDNWFSRTVDALHSTPVDHGTQLTGDEWCSDKTTKSDEFLMAAK